MVTATGSPVRPRAAAGYTAVSTAPTPVPSPVTLVGAPRTSTGEAGAVPAATRTQAPPVSRAQALGGMRTYSTVRSPVVTETVDAAPTERPDALTMVLPPAVTDVPKALAARSGASALARTPAAAEGSGAEFAPVAAGAVVAVGLAAGDAGAGLQAVTAASTRMAPPRRDHPKCASRPVTEVKGACPGPGPSRRRGCHPYGCPSGWRLAAPSC